MIWIRDVPVCFVLLSDSLSFAAQSWKLISNISRIQNRYLYCCVKADQSIALPILRLIIYEETGAKDPSRSNCFTVRNVLEANSTMRVAEHATMHYCFVWKKWQWPVSLWMEANLCLNTGGGRVVRGELSGGRRRRPAVYWELDQWQVNPLSRKPFIFVKAFLLEIHWGPEGHWLVSRWRSDRNWLVYWELHSPFNI